MFRSACDTVSTPTKSLEDALQARIITNMNELTELLNLPQDHTARVRLASQSFSLRFPDSLLPRVQRGQISDPVLIQFLPDERELVKPPGLSEDRLSEWKSVSSESDVASRDPYILQKYSGRALILTTHSCAARCRFCFRRYFPKDRALFPVPRDAVSLGLARYLQEALKPIQADSTIHELIFSGGDPLTLNNDELYGLLNYTKSLPHVKRVRFHSRVPVLTPARIDEDFPSFNDFNDSNELAPLILHLAIHVNSPNEIDESVMAAILRLRAKGYVLTSQTTLLRGVNDKLEVLLALYETLINLGVVPYYLFQLDRVQGAAHWETPTELGRTLIRELSARLPGYAVPKFAREIPGFPMKADLSVEKTLK